MAPITLFTGEPDFFDYYGYFIRNSTNTTPGFTAPIITNIQDPVDGNYFGVYELSAYRYLKVPSINILAEVPPLFKVVEALYITETIYDTKLIYPNNQFDNTETPGGYVRIKSFNTVRSNIQLSFDPLLEPNLIPFNQTPLTGERNNSNELPIDWGYQEAPSGYNPIIETKSGFLIFDSTQVNTYDGINIQCKIWTKTPAQPNYIEPTGHIYRLYEIPTMIEEVVKPIYIDLLSGYSEDARTIPNKPIVDIDEPKTIKVSYYRENKDEPIPDMRSIDWMTYWVELNIGLNILPIIDCVLGTLNISDSLVKSKILQLTTVNEKYPFKYYFLENLPDLFNQWYELAGLTLPVTQGNLRLIGANNNYWNNRTVPTADVNYNLAHQLFVVNNQRAYDWHIKPQIDGSYGDLVMNSPILIELHQAFNAGLYQTETPAVIGTGTIDNPQTPATHTLDWYIKNSSIGAVLANRITAIWKALGGDRYGKNELDNTKERVTNLGFLTERIAKVLGIRFDDNGKIDVDKEKSMVRKVINGSQNIDPEKIGVNGYGDGGMVVKRINNRVNKKGQIVSDQCVVLQDFPDLVQEYFEQANLALGIQESSAIEIKQDGTTARFSSQLEILMELVNLMSSGNEMTRAALVSSLVTQSQTNELIAGLGLPSVTKTIPIKIGKQVTQVPFKGIAAHRSISQEVATATYNIGIVLGQVL